jgi:hypothetical protein
MKTLLVGVGGLEAKLHKTDDIWFMYITIPNTKAEDMQLIFKSKAEAKKCFDEINRRIQGVKL